MCVWERKCVCVQGGAYKSKKEPALANECTSSSPARFDIYSAIYVGNVHLLNNSLAEYMEKLSAVLWSDQSSLINLNVVVIRQIYDNTSLGKLENIGRSYSVFWHSILASVFFKLD